MLPHDIVATLFAYEENFQKVFLSNAGSVESYWDQNMDLFDSLGLSESEPRWNYAHFFVYRYIIYLVLNELSLVNTLVFAGIN